jgi:hypothetical protein
MTASQGGREAARRGQANREETWVRIPHSPLRRGVRLVVRAPLAFYVREEELPDSSPSQGEDSRGEHRSRMPIGLDAEVAEAMTF